MKNEVFARAITEIDDELILSAHKNIVSRKKRKTWFFAAAACFFLICAAALYLRGSRGIEVFVYGNTISDEPVTIDLPASLSSEQRMTVSDALTIPIEIKSKHKMELKAEQGELEVYSLETNELLDEGQICKTLNSVTVFWTIDILNPKQIYKLRINNHAAVLQLSYSEDIDNWILNKQ